MMSAGSKTGVQARASRRCVCRHATRRITCVVERGLVGWLPPPCPAVLSSLGRLFLSVLVYSPQWRMCRP